MMGDGAIKFISDSIDPGDTSATTVFVNLGGVDSTDYDPDAVAGSKSRYGVWGAMGTRASRESVGNQAL